MSLVAANFAAEVDALTTSNSFVPMTASLTRVSCIHILYSDSDKVSFVLNHLLELIKRPFVQIRSLFLMAVVSSLANARQILHADYTNTVGDSMIDDLTADLVIEISYPALFLVAQLTDGIQLLGFAEPSAKTRITAPNKGSLVAFEEKRLRTDRSDCQEA